MPSRQPTATTGAALRTFPVLLKWGLTTRPGVHAYPIGGSSHARRRRAAAFSDDEKRACVRDNAATLYHDLGVVAFDGCSHQQAQRVGDILAKTVALRARRRAAVVAGVDVPEERALEAFEVFPALWKLEEETWGHRLDG
ncbi:HAD family hydrolase [Beauveria brongniartii RCEF 3172]|uniref:HAD family hydrolase n=1 Tax=Beauveria brongniartii RCEF 3172 TaxID=1081107 RepID=A0A162JPL6_9HYPO|nr:HAD family hydrolase [Beauveria brongniartii RCEF 3172]